MKPKKKRKTRRGKTKMKREYGVTLCEILKHMESIEQLTNEVTYTKFIIDKSLQNKCLGKIIQICREAEKISANEKEECLKQVCPDFDWDFIESCHDSVFHPQFGLNSEKLWDIVKIDVPFQKKKLKQILSKTQ